MDKNSITGLLLITAILALFWWMNKPSDEEMEARKRQLDSIDRVEQQQQEQQTEESADTATEAPTEADTTQAETAEEKASRSEAAGMLASYVDGEQEFITLENENIKVTLTNQGGRVYSVEVKDYETHDGRPLVLFDGEENRFGFNFTYNTQIFNTNDLYFDVVEEGENAVTFEITGPERERLAFSYNLSDDDYMLDHTIDSRNLGNKFSTPRNAIDLEWYQEMPAQEQGRKFEE
ncbi:MAG: YidC/Oxa1 family insertase periplasmic-domain containing protein, partial [Marinilabiliaceae bacterium]